MHFPMGNSALLQFKLLLQYSFFCFSIFRLASCTCIATEKNALLKLRQSLKDPSGRLSSWVGEDDCCRWEGVTCDYKTGNVVRLNLRNPFPRMPDFAGRVTTPPSELGGEINPSLQDLTFLTHLDLSSNNFGGIEVPRFLGNLTQLVYLNLSTSSFSGSVSPFLGNLSRLQYLDLSFYSNEPAENDLLWLPALSSLKYLDLGGSDLSKAAPYWLQSVNSVPHLLELHLPQCQLLQLPNSLHSPNLTSLSVIELSNNAFNSTLPDWFFNLTSLRVLDLNSNNLYGRLPDDKFAQLTSLEYIDLSSNYGFQGELTKRLATPLCNLKTLSLSYNSITGDLTEFTGSLSKCQNGSGMESLGLEFNELTGTLPSTLGSLGNLRYLGLGQNLLQGSVPDSIGNLSSLNVLDLSFNHMKGNISKNLGKLSSLVTLDLSENPWQGVITEAHLMNLSSLQEFVVGIKLSPIINGLVFNISSDWVPPFKLILLTIQSSVVGPKFPRWLRNQNLLTNLILNHGGISDAVPDWFLELDLQLDELDMAFNQLSGKVPNTFKLNFLANVDLSVNLFEGPLPLWSSNVTSLSLRQNRFSGPIPSNFGTAYPNMTDLDLSINFLNGSIPMSLRNMNYLTTLDISNNFLSGEIPNVFDSMPFLYVLEMSNNSLSGEIPNSIGALHYLRFFRLSSNRISGELPASLRNCSAMISLDLGDNQLSGDIPSWLGESMTSLWIFRLRNNSFTGIIPSQICSLSVLHILDLSVNKLSGTIPSCINDMNGFNTDLTTDEYGRYEGKLEVFAKGRLLKYDSTLYLVNSIDLSSNNLSGEIPQEITSLLKLGTLNLSRNHLTGEIPTSIDKLILLETLDLSMNQLTGKIPESMVSLTFLNHLNLSHNNLSGPIPSSNQFQTLNDPSFFAGNIGLCGPPLTASCTDDEKAGTDEQDTDRKDRTEKIWFFITIGFGYFLGFWGILGTIILKTQWRYAYFYYLDECFNTMYVRYHILLRRHSSHAIQPSRQ